MGVFNRETGTGDASSNTYTTVALADTYLDNSGRKAGVWADLGNTGKEQALVNAWNYIIARWEGRWLGIAVEKLQAGAWPRREMFYPSGHAVAFNEIPAQLEHAQIEYAYAYAVGGDLVPNPEYDDSNRSVTSKSDKVGPLEESRSFSDRSKPETYRKYPLADGLLKPWLLGGATQALLRM